MGRVRVYINPFDSLGTYTGYEEVTKYVNDKNFTLKRKVDNDDYNVGVFKYNNIGLTLNNSKGIFSDVDNIRSMFAYKRSGSKVKITWDLSTKDNLCGVAETDYSYISEEVTIFEGLLSDQGTKTEIRQQDINFAVLGMESIFSEVETPFSILANGDNANDIIFDCLNQTEITDLLTVDYINVSLSINPSVDAVADLENTTVKEALDFLLEVSNSILYIKDSTVYVTARTAAASVGHTFYGQGAIDGIEDIIKIDSIRQGLNKTFNFLTWQDTTLSNQDASSVTLYGLRKKEISFSGITNNTTRTNIMTDIKDEFKLPKQEMVLKAALTYDLIDLEILDRVAIIYPNVYFPATDAGLPIYGVAIFGEAVLPYGEWSLTLDDTTNFKILGKDISIKSEVITFYLREI